MIKPPWSHVVRLGAVGRDPITTALVADEAARKRIARLLQLDDLLALSAEVTTIPWFDGLEIQGQWQAQVMQTCGVTLDPLPSAPTGFFIVKVVPADSPHAPSAEDEIAIDLEADDPPDVLENDDIDLAAYVVEHLALEIDPFPRKPDVEFEAPADEGELSPFAVLKRLQTPDKA